MAEAPTTNPPPGIAVGGPQEGAPVDSPARRIPLKELPLAVLLDEDGIERSGPPPQGYAGGNEGEEDEDADLPLLRGDVSDKGAADLGALGSVSFRQRNMHYIDGIVNGKGSGRLEVEGGGGMVHSVSRAKLEADGEYALGSPSAAYLLKTLFFISVWYTFSTSLTIYNKTLLGDKLGRFPAPLLMNTVHFTMQAVLSNVISWFQLRKSEITVSMAWKDYLLRVVPTALATALDINLSNASLVSISVTFATMCKSASPIFLLIFAFVFRLESPSINLFGIIFVISTGVLLTVAKETEFEFWGFIFVMLAAFTSGFRWSMTQILLQKDAYGLKNPITLMSYVAPVMAVSTFILSLIMDPWQDFYSNSYFDSSWHISRSCLLMIIGGSLAFFMVLTEYVLVSATSAVTVTIAGVVKEAFTVLVAVFYFHDQFTLLKAVGLLIIMIGVSLFNWYKYKKLQKSHTSIDEITLPVSNEAKYVILDEMDLLGDEV